MSTKAGFGLGSAANWWVKSRCGWFIRFSELHGLFCLFALVDVDIFEMIGIGGLSGRKWTYGADRRVYIRNARDCYYSN